MDALYFATDTPVRGPSADFSRLPYTDGKTDSNCDVANLSEEIVAEPLDPPGHYLKAGVHLHWALPDALTKATLKPDGAIFPRVPNRWLIVRTGFSTSDPMGWIVESDYLSKDGAAADAESIAYPVIGPRTPGTPPFRFLGRSTPLKNWHEATSDAADRPALTAIGYGEPTFAAFYPNCHNVFGFHDPDIVHSPLAPLQYDVIGWYDRPDQDWLAVTLAAATKASPATADLHQVVGEILGWTLPSPADAPQLAQILCHSRISFQPTTPAPAPATADCRVAIANTASEALSALLARLVRDAEDPAKVATAVSKGDLEAQLEALALSSQLDHLQLDVGAKFLEARHSKGFASVTAGSLWTIVPRGADAAQAQSTLPEPLAHLLNELNLRQQACDDAHDEIASRRHQLFADWYKYMLSAYPPEDSRDEYPDIDEVKYFIEEAVLAPLEAKIKATKASLGAQLRTAREAVRTGVEACNASAPKPATHFALKRVAAPRFYRPTDPALVLTGPALTPNLRYGNAGEPLACSLYEGLPPATITAGQLPDFVNGFNGGPS